MKILYTDTDDAFANVNHVDQEKQQCEVQNEQIDLHQEVAMEEIIVSDSTIESRPVETVQDTSGRTLPKFVILSIYTIHWAYLTPSFSTFVIILKQWI